jgi:outer membrane protein
MFRLSGSGALLVAAAAILTVSAATAQTKVAVINAQKAMLDTAELKKAQAWLEAKFKPRQEEIAKLQKDVDDIQKQLQTMGDKLTQQAQSDMTTQMQRKQREIQRLGEDLQADVDRERTGILSNASRHMQEIIDKLAAEKGVDVVLAASTTLFFKPVLELTKEATEAYDKAFPVK